jgi:PncC family amidohydrolase
VPFELEQFLGRDLVPWLAERSGGRGIGRRTLRVALRPESEVDQRLAPLYAEFGRESVTLLAAPGEVRVVLIAAGDPPAIAERLDRLATRTRELLGEALYGEGEGGSLEAVVGAVLVERGLTIAVAESCTGGLVCERLTAVAGASRYFPGGVVTYANEQKEQLLASATSSSRRTARSPSRWRGRWPTERGRFGAGLGIGVTGIAGRTATARKPVGTVHRGRGAGSVRSIAASSCPAIASGSGGRRRNCARAGARGLLGLGPGRHGRSVALELRPVRRSIAQVEPARPVPAGELGARAEPPPDPALPRRADQPQSLVAARVFAAAEIDRPWSRWSSRRREIFPNAAIRVVWLALEPAAELARLADAVRAAALRAELPFDPKPFRPHLTLARCRVPWPPALQPELARLAAEPAPRFVAERVRLISSVLGAGGPTYSTVAELALREAA